MTAESESWNPNILQLDLSLIGQTKMFQPLRVGEHCPLNETAWMARKSQFNCTDTGGNPAKEYHCLPNNLGVPGEVCIGSSWVQPSKSLCFN